MWGCECCCLPVSVSILGLCWQLGFLILDSCCGATNVAFLDHLEQREVDVNQALGQVTASCRQQYTHVAVGVLVPTAAGARTSGLKLVFWRTQVDPLPSAPLPPPSGCPGKIDTFSHWNTIALYSAL